MEIGEKIKQRRMQLGWSQRDLASRMGYTNNSTIAKIEQGKVDVSQARVVQFSKVLGVTIAWLMDWEEEEKKNDQLVPLVTRLRRDDKFMEAVQMLDTLSPQQFDAVMQMLTAFNHK
jgi:transcriptional regulator with XRE-family HTH domain